MFGIPTYQGYSLQVGGLCFSPQDLAKEYPEPIKGWAILRSPFMGIGERRRREFPYPLSLQEAWEKIGEKHASFCYFFF